MKKVSLRKHSSNNMERVSQNSLFFLSFDNFSLQVGDKIILENFSDSYEYCGIVVLKGRVGSGKTSILKSIAGLTDYTGSINHVDKENRQVDSIFIHSVSEFNFITGYVSDELAFAGIDKNKFHELSGRSVYDMSGGELKKLSIMMALARGGNSVILLDEPLDMLDDTESKTVADLIIESSTSRPFIIATHDDLFDERADVIISFE